MKRFVYCFYILLFTLLVSCAKTENKPLEIDLTGKWTEHIPDGTAYFEAMLHIFTFKEDSFYAKIISWTDAVVIIPGEPCLRKGYEEIFSKGKFSIENDSLYISGKLCDSLYQQLKPTCEGVSDFIYQYHFTKNDTSIILNADQPSSFGYGIILKKE